MSEPLRRQVRFATPRAVGAVLAVFRRGGGDPTSYREPGQWWHAWTTPEGPVTLLLQGAAVAEHVEASAWGAGASWMLEQVPLLLGEADDPAGFEPQHDIVRQAWRRYPGWRVPRSGLVVQALIPAVIEQKVTGREAFASYRQLVRARGRTAPGPGASLGMRCPPDAAGWAAIPSWEWLQAGVDAARSAPAVGAAGRGGRLEECRQLPLADAHRRLRALPGIGVWTSAEVAQRALGDPDSVSFGDYHVAKNLGWALTGEEVDDAGLAELLEPYAGHRYRVQRLIELLGVERPRRGPRRTLPGHLPRFRP